MDVMFQFADGRELWPQQVLMRDHALSTRRDWWLAGCGLGKTSGAIAVAQSINSELTLVLTLHKLIRNVWEREVLEATSGLTVLPVYKGTTTQKMQSIREAIQQRTGPLMVVINYESAYRMPLGEIQWDYVFADESHRLKSYNAQTSNKLASALKSVPYMTLGTGTGWEDKPLDVYGQIRMLTPKHRPGNKYLCSSVLGCYTRFFDEYARYYERDNIKIPTGWKNLDRLADLIRPYTLTLRRQDWLDLTNAQHITLKIELPSKVMNEYRKLDKELIAFNNTIIADNPLVLMLRLHQVSSGFYADTYGDEVLIPDGQVKLDTLAELAETFGSEPFLVYANFRTSLRLIEERFEGMGIKTSALSGDRDDLAEWERGETQALVLQIQAGSAGLNLTRAPIVVYYELTASATNFIQSQYRVDRPGQRKDITNYYLLAEDTVDEEILATLRTKKRDAETLDNLLKL